MMKHVPEGQLERGSIAARFLSGAAIAALLITPATLARMSAQTPAATAPAPAPPAGQARGIVASEYPVLPIGSAIPDFSLPGIDGKTHKLAEYTKTKLLAVVFESNHCPVSQLYEDRVEKLYADYKSKGVTLVAINPNNPLAVRLDELAYTDVTDSFEDMKYRAKFRGMEWPYLYDGEAQEVSKKFGAVATPHIFIFGEDKKLAYQGRIDNNQREELATQFDARNALDALLAGKPVPVATTRAFGCSTKWMSKNADVAAEWKRITSEPVALEAIDIEGIKALKANATDRITLINFWSTKSKVSTDQFFDLETTYRMFRQHRLFNMVTVNLDAAADNAAALAHLKKEFATGPNKQYVGDRKAVMDAVGATWPANQPYTMLVAPGGEVVYSKVGKVDIFEVRRAMLVTMPDNRSYVGGKAYWTKAVAEAKKK